MSLEAAWDSGAITCGKQIPRDKQFARCLISSTSSPLTGQEKKTMEYPSKDRDYGNEMQLMGLLKNSGISADLHGSYHQLSKS